MSFKQINLGNQEIEVNWNDITEVPTIFPTDWNNVNDKPATFPSTWNEINGKPSVFPTNWSNVTGKPTIFPSDWSQLSGHPFDSSELEDEFQDFMGWASITFLGKSQKATDSDKLDGLNSSQFLRSDTGTIPDARLPATITSSITGNAATATKLATARTISLTGDVTGSTTFDGSANRSITCAIANNSHNHTIANVSGLQTALNGKLAVGATAADSSKLGGAVKSTSATGNTIVQRNSSGYVYANFFNTSPNDVSSGVTRICVETGNDGFIRHGTADAIRAFVGKVDDSNLFDGLNSTQFMRSDANDAKTAGYTRYNDGTSAQFGNSADLTVSHNGHHSYIQNNTGYLYIQQRLHGGAILIQAQNTAGANRAAIYARPNYQSLFGDGAEKLRVDSDGIKVFGRITCGYDPGYNKSIGCAGWFRSSGNTGWINATYGGGIYMQDSIWIRTYGNKGFYTGSGDLRTDGRLQIGARGTGLEIDHLNDTAIDNYVGHMYYRNYAHGKWHYFQAEDSGGTNRACAYFNASYQRLFNGGQEKFRTLPNGVRVTSNLYCSSVFNDGGNLHLQGNEIVLAASSSSGNARIFMRSGSNTMDYGWNGYSNNFLYLQTYNNNKTTFRQNLARFGEAEIRFYSPHVQNSGANFKTVLEPIQNALETVSKLNPIFYHYNDRPAEEIQAGFVAEEVLKEAPETHVVFGEEGDLGIDYSKVGVWAIAAIKELSRQVHSLTEKVNQLEKNNND